MSLPNPKSLAFSYAFCVFVFLYERPNQFSVGTCCMYLPNWPQYKGFCASWKLEINVLAKNNRDMWSGCCWQILCAFSSILKVMLELLLLVVTSDICHASQEDPWPSSEKFLTDLKSSSIQTWSTCFIRYFFKQEAVDSAIIYETKIHIHRYWKLMALIIFSFYDYAGEASAKHFNIHID